MEFWNNSYAYLNPESTCFVSCQIVWQAFVQESVRNINLASQQHLTLSDKLSINEVPQEALIILETMGL